MGKKKSYEPSQLLDYSKDSYLERTSRPVYAIIFLIPFIITYELGSIFIQTSVLNSHMQGRVVAFSWVQGFVEFLGFSSRFAWIVTPLVVIFILLGLQIASKKRWKFWLTDLFPMSIECVLFAIPLIVLGFVLNDSGKQVTPNTPPMQTAIVQTSITNCSAVSSNLTEPQYQPQTSQQRYWLADIITGIGAGIYEELVFRLVLICILMLIFQDFFKFNRTAAIVISILISAALFSAHHHIDFLNWQPTREPFDIAKFVFRALAGVYFACLFAARGFGITAGTHAFYDIMAVVINVKFLNN
ncbi:MAG: CPBP family intramembrane metalloprotease [Planctomycetes bacterium]|nr:CPBP family intramembrane metalloprotease [Planctomycetota bacterium]